MKVNKAAHFWRVMIVAALAAVIVMVLAAAASGSVFLRASTDSGGNQANGPSINPAISVDGRFIAFESTATNLLAGDTNAVSDVFVKDTVTGEVTRVSTNTAAAQSNGASSLPSISADGRFVAFQSSANNLVTGDTNGIDDVFVKDRLTGATTRVSTTSAGAQVPAFYHSRAPSISADGRYVSFLSAGVLAPGSFGSTNVFVKDRLTGQTVRASTDSAGVTQNHYSWYAAISGGGRYVAFSASAFNLVPGDTNNAQDVFLKDLVTGVTSRVSTDSLGNQINGSGSTSDGGSKAPSITSDGRYIAFESNSTNAVSGDTNGVNDIYVKDTTSGALTRVSTDHNGAQANGQSIQGKISADGRFVAFYSDASNLVLGDTNGSGDIFIKDLSTGQIALVSTNANGDPAGPVWEECFGDPYEDLPEDIYCIVHGGSSSPAVNGDGMAIAFQSEAANLVTGDTNAQIDVFVTSNDIDNSAPVISNLQPAAAVSQYTVTISADYADVGQGIYVASAAISLDGVGLSGCTASSSSISCQYSNLSPGPHSYTVSVMDWAGNTSTSSASFIFGDSAPPAISSVLPSGSITSTSAVVAVYYSDADSGVNTSAVSVTLDGAAMSGCSIDASNASCAAYGLSTGAHTIGGSVADTAGNAATISGGFTVSSPPPPPSSRVPHGGYGTSNAPSGARTDLCLSCHDIHQAAGDYALMREATVTETCNTCHALFGVAADGTWTETPSSLVDGAEPLTSGAAAYENTGAARQSGHRLGVSLDANSHVSDAIPGSNLTLKVMDSEAYQEGELYPGDSVLGYGATNGLYCASCHTPHGSVGGTDQNGDGVTDAPIPVNNYDSAGNVTSQAFFGDQLVTVEQGHSGPPAEKVKAQKLISSNPNHVAERSLKREVAADGAACPAKTGATDVADDSLINNGKCDSFISVDEPATTYNNWCLQCHNLQWNGAEWEGIEMHGTPGVSNHPPLCVSCHSSSGGNKGVKDFPHTSANVKLLSKDHDGICLGCHSGGKLP